MESEHIMFEMIGRSATGKTEIWEVVARDGGTVLGSVRWFGRWTQYAFYPNPGMVFEKTCLRDIANFCVDLTGAQRRAAHARRWDK